jgi:hypothetical protein
MMQASPFFDSEVTPIRITRISKRTSTTPELYLNDSLSQTKSFCVASIAEKFLPNISFSETFTTARLTKPVAKRRSVRTPRCRPYKSHTWDAFLSTTLRMHQNANPLLLAQKDRYTKPTSQGHFSSSHSSTKYRPTQMRITGPFTPNDPEMSMTIRAACLSQAVVKVRVRGHTASPTSRKKVEVKVPSTGDYDVHRVTSLGGI